MDHFDGKKRELPSIQHRSTASVSCVSEACTLALESDSPADSGFAGRSRNLQREASLQRLPSPSPSSARQPQWQLHRSGAQSVSSSASGSRSCTCHSLHASDECIEILIKIHVALCPLPPRRETEASQGLRDKSTRSPLQSSETPPVWDGICFGLAHSRMSSSSAFECCCRTFVDKVAKGCGMTSYKAIAFRSGNRQYSLFRKHVAKSLACALWRQGTCHLGTRQRRTRSEL